MQKPENQIHATLPSAIIILRPVSTFAQMIETFSFLFLIGSYRPITKRKENVLLILHESGHQPLKLIIFEVEQ